MLQLRQFVAQSVQEPDLAMHLILQVAQKSGLFGQLEHEGSVHGTHFPPTRAPFEQLVQMAGFD